MMNLLICKICKGKFRSRFSNKNTCSSECNRIYQNTQRNNLKNRLKNCKYCNQPFLSNFATVLCKKCKNTRKVIDKKIKVTYLCPNCNGMSYVKLAKMGKERIFISKTFCKLCKEKIQYNKNNQARIHAIRTRLYRAWVLPILRRDKFICQKCGKGGNELEVHHDQETFSEVVKRITKNRNLSEFNYKSFKKIADKIIKEHNKISGITLCIDHHAEIDPQRRIWGKKN